MLRLIPRAPSKIAVKHLQEQLRDADFQVTARTVQRDLIDLVDTSEALGRPVSGSLLLDRRSA